MSDAKEQKVLINRKKHSKYTYIPRLSSTEEFMLAIAKVEFISFLVITEGMLNSTEEGE
jgi:hypothetical protein